MKKLQVVNTFAEVEVFLKITYRNFRILGDVAKCTAKNDFKASD